MLAAKRLTARHLRTEYVVAFAGHRRIDQSEVDTRRSHGEDQDRVDHRTVEIGDAGVLGRETARGARRHGVAERIEPVHARHFEQYRRQHRKAHIDHQQNLHDDLGPVAVIILGQGRKLDARQRHLVAPQRGEDQQGEHDHAHTPDPRRGHAPELQPPRQHLDIVQDRRSGRRKARNAFEPSVHQTELPTPDQVGEHADQTGDQPRADHDAESLLVGDLLRTFDEDQRKRPQEGREQRREQQGIERRIHAADKGNPRRQQHEQRDEKHHDPDISQNHVYSHRNQDFGCLETVIRVSIFSFSSKTSSLQSALTANGTRNER